MPSGVCASHQHLLSKFGGVEALRNLELISPLLRTNVYQLGIGLPAAAAITQQ